MKKPPPNPAKQLVYGSEMIVERRRRILREVRHLVAEHGVNGFSMRELCKRADVAYRTVYNAFHSKERAIAFAIQETYDVFAARANFETDPATLAGMMDRKLTTNRRNLEIRNYTSAIMSIYFSPTTNQDIWLTIHDIAISSSLPWLESLAEKGQLRAGTEPRRVADAIARQEYSTINDWCQKRIADKDFLKIFLDGVLSIAAASVRGAALKEVNAALDDLRERGVVPDYPHPEMTRRRASS